MRTSSLASSFASSLLPPSPAAGAAEAAVAAASSSGLSRISLICGQAGTDDISVLAEDLTMLGLVLSLESLLRTHGVSATQGIALYIHGRGSGSASRAADSKDGTSVA